MDMALSEYQKNTPVVLLSHSLIMSYTSQTAGVFF